MADSELNLSKPEWRAGELNLSKYEGHTAGPWESGGCVVWQKNGDCLADLVGGTANGARPPDEIEANCNIMTDAPLLLAEVKRLRESTAVGVVEEIVAERDRLRAALQRLISHADGYMQYHAEKFYGDSGDNLVGIRPEIARAREALSPEAPDGE